MQDDDAPISQEVPVDAAGRPQRAEEAHEGWKEIAAALGTCDKTAMRLSVRDYDPLPVRFDFLERPYIYTTALKSWLNRQDLPSHAYHELRRLGRLPGQIRRKTHTKSGRKALSPVQRAEASTRRRR